MTKNSCLKCKKSKNVLEILVSKPFISKGTWTQKQSSRWHFSSNERIGENCETKTADSAVKDHKSNARARMGKTREDLGTNYLLSSGKTEGRRLKPVFLRPIFFFKFDTICLKV